MARDPIYPLRLSADRRERWEAAAKASGLALAEFVRQAGDDAAAQVEGGGKSRPARAAAPRPAAAKTGRARTQLCEHRRLPEEFCSRCDT